MNEVIQFFSTAKPIFDVLGTPLALILLTLVLWATRKPKRHDKKLEKVLPNFKSISDEILNADKNISNVLIMNYHNGTVSSHGLAYKYITCIYEGFRGYKSKPLIDFWKELNYANFYDEIARINNSKYIVIDKESLDEFPKLYNKLEECNLEDGVVMPIKTDSGQAVGLLWILYENGTLDVNNKTIHFTINKNLNKLATILDEK